ncbi:MAG TPA: hypothetical protein VJ919_06890 [Tangfeifania sp.]|nr:hypothetical protein [Tangfeifania sp.]
MKAVILISSIFYIIGLKVSSQIDLAGKSNPVDTLISTKIIPLQPAKSVQIFQSDENSNDVDSIKSEQPLKEQDNQS